MLESHIQISDDLAVSGTKKALRFKALKQLMSTYASIISIILIVVVGADIFWEGPHLIIKHLLLLFGLWAFAVMYSYREWLKNINKMRGWSFHARLDDLGVHVHQTMDDLIRWDSYKGYREFDNYLEIENVSGAISFLPKVPELFDVIEFSKEKIPVK